MKKTVLQFILTIWALLAWSALLPAQDVTAPPSAAIATNTPPAAVAPAPHSNDDSFAGFLVAREGQLTPFYNAYSNQVQADFVEVYGIYAHLVVIILIGWMILDAILGRVYASMVAPTYATFVRTFFYSAGKMLLSILTLAVAGFGLVLLIMVAGHFTGANAAMVVLLIISLMMLAVQTVLANLVFHSSYVVSLGFIVTSNVVALALLSLYFLIEPVKLGQLYHEFVDFKVAGRIDQERERVETEISSVQKDYDRLTTQLQNQAVTQAASDQDKQSLNDKIKEELASDHYKYQQIAQVAAQGDLPATIKAYQDFVQNYPSSPLVPLARQRITDSQTQFDNQTAAQKLAEQKAEAAAAAEEAALVEKLNRGQATLSEMLHRLHFKSRDDVRIFLGSPNKIDIDVWGFDRPLVYSPEDKKSYGLAVYFVENKVQSVNYFYGSKSR